MRPAHLFRSSGLNNLGLRPLKLLYLPLFAFLGFGLYQLLFGSLFTISTISCTFDGQACEQDFRNQLSFLQGTSTLRFEPSIVEAKLLKQNPFLAQITFQVIFPHQLTVTATSQQNLIHLDLVRLPSIAPTPTPTPTLQVASEATPAATTSPHQLAVLFSYIDTPPFDSLLLTSSGQLLAANQIKTANQITLFISTDLPGKTTLTQLFLLFHELRLSGLTGRISAHQETAFLKLNDSYAIFSLASDPRATVASLQQILGESTINSNQAIIDLRFSNPVITKINN